MKDYFSAKIPKAMAVAVCLIWVFSAASPEALRADTFQDSLQRE
jgi:hypothetical protein